MLQEILTVSLGSSSHWLQCEEMIDTHNMKHKAAFRCTETVPGNPKWAFRQLSFCSHVPAWHSLFFTATALRSFHFLYYILWSAGYFSNTAEFTGSNQAMQLPKKVVGYLADACKGNLMLPARDSPHLDLFNCIRYNVLKWLTVCNWARTVVRTLHRFGYVTKILDILAEYGLPRACFWTLLDLFYNKTKLQCQRVWTVNGGLSVCEVT